MSRLFVLISVLSVETFVNGEVWPRPQVHVKTDKYYVINRNGNIPVEIVNHKCNILMNALNQFDNFEVINIKNKRYAPKSLNKTKNSLPQNLIRTQTDNIEKINQKNKRDVSGSKILNKTKHSLPENVNKNHPDNLKKINKRNKRDLNSPEILNENDDSLYQHSITTTQPDLAEETHSDLAEQTHSDLDEQKKTDLPEQQNQSSNVSRVTPLEDSNDAWFDVSDGSSAQWEKTKDNYTWIKIPSKRDDEHLNSTEEWMGIRTERNSSDHGTNLNYEGTGSSNEQMLENTDDGQMDNSLEWKMANPEEVRAELSLESTLGYADEQMKLVTNLIQLPVESSNHGWIDMKAKFNSSDNTTIPLGKNYNQQVINSVEDWLDDSSVFMDSNEMMSSLVNRSIKHRTNISDVWSVTTKQPMFNTSEQNMSKSPRVEDFRVQPFMENIENDWLNSNEPYTKHKTSWPYILLLEPKQKQIKKKVSKSTPEPTTTSYHHTDQHLNEETPKQKQITKEGSKSTQEPTTTSDHHTDQHLNEEMPKQKQITKEISKSTPEPTTTSNHHTHQHLNKETVSEQALDSTTIPSTTIPSTTIPSTTLTEIDSTIVPSITIPSPKIPSTTVHLHKIPSTTIHHHKIPSSTVPLTTIPSTTIPSTTIHSPKIPSTTVRSHQIPSTTIHSHNIPSTTIRSHKIPSTTIPSTTIPSTTIPSTTEKPTTIRRLKSEEKIVHVISPLVLDTDHAIDLGKRDTSSPSFEKPDRTSLPSFQNHKSGTSLNSHIENSDNIASKPNLPKEVKSDHQQDEADMPKVINSNKEQSNDSLPPVVNSDRKGNIKNRQVTKKRDPHYNTLKKLIINLTAPCEEMPHLKMVETYTLTVTAEAVLVSSSVWGVIRGLYSFSEMLYTVGNETRINRTRIEDRPRYAHRGLMLDTAIHYVPVQNILDTLDAMAMNKLNVFHWHLSDDESFPYVSERFPLLSKKGAYCDTMVYKKSDVKQVVEYARDRGIRVVPEFTIPGHTRAWGKGYPNLLTKCYSGKHVSRLGPLNPIRDETYAFLADFFKEVNAAFPDKMVYFGGNEIDMSCWNSNPDIVDYIGYFGVRSINELLILFMRNVLPNYSNGTDITFSEDIFLANVPLPADSIIQVSKRDSWSHKLLSVLNANLRAILTWNLEDEHQLMDIYEEDPRESVPVACEKDPLFCYNIIGGEASLLGNMANNKNNLSKIWKKVSVIAELLWSNKLDLVHRNGGVITKEVRAHLCHMIKMGLPANEKCRK